MNSLGYRSIEGKIRSDLMMDTTEVQVMSKLKVTSTVIMMPKIFLQRNIISRGGCEECLGTTTRKRPVMLSKSRDLPRRRLSAAGRA
jgi:hypothetical protein